MRKDAIDGFIAIWENATKVRYTAKGKRLFKETLQSAGYRLAGPGECVVRNSWLMEVYRYLNGSPSVSAIEIAGQIRTMLQQKAPGSGEASEGSNKNDRLRDLLGRYANHVNSWEGIDYLSDTWSDDSGSYHSLTNAEIAEIAEYAAEVRRKANPSKGEQ